MRQGGGEGDGGEKRGRKFEKAEFKLKVPADGKLVQISDS